MSTESLDIIIPTATAAIFSCNMRKILLHIHKKTGEILPL